MKKPATIPREGRTTSKITGEHYSAFIVSLFSKQNENKYPDETLAHILSEHFPSRSSEKNYLRYIPQYRNKYNRGEFSHQSKPPDVKMIRYEFGEAKPQSRGPRPRSEQC